MNNVKLYPGIKDKRVYIVEVYGQIDVWSMELDEPIGCVTSRQAFAKQAVADGWVPMSNKNNPNLSTVGR